MVFVPKTYTDGVRTEVANSPGEESDLLWRGWLLVGTYTPPPYVIPPAEIAAFRDLLSTILNDSSGLPAVSFRNGGGITLNRWTFPTWGYGGNASTKNQFSPTLFDLNELGVSRLLWFPGTIGNLVTTPNTSMFDGNVSGVPQVVTFQVDMVTNEWDAVTGQSSYNLISKPNSWLFRLTETGFPEVRMFDSVGGVTLTANATYAPKERLYLQVVFTPNDGGVCRADFNTSSDGGATWQPFGDSIFGTRALGAYPTPSLSTFGVLVGGNSTSSAFRGGLISAQIKFGTVLAADLRPSTWAAGSTLGTDSVGNVWTIQAPVASNLVNQTCIAVGSGEYLTLTGAPTGVQLSSPGLYSSLSLSGFSWDLSKPPALLAYKESNAVVNIASAPSSISVDLYPDSDGNLIGNLTGRTTRIASAT